MTTADSGRCLDGVHSEITRIVSEKQKTISLKACGRQIRRLRWLGTTRLYYSPSSTGSPHAEVKLFRLNDGELSPHSARIFTPSGGRRILVSLADGVFLQMNDIRNQPTPLLTVLISHLLRQQRCRIICSWFSPLQNVEQE
jgi:hypothetical protein